ncbi:MAG: GuaB3 family IMP dehydrogenase-related protein [Candidatus Nanopelagicales bacterium]|nr:GuaB3 family IMP dehydrogenase-related protein [Candidatus Nanopelagicales bacterium]MCF8537873.1 GuaB3 family IMP dehydrogenase-related protein [Candidatus Nanopelagicales bacterium]MCF8558361.1 GuaB3 family IMP dehydrogenase-related protein [Candidatus Nanopelagicales bacterium]
MTDIQIGGAKRGRRGYSLDEVAIAPSRRTRDPEAVSTAWTIDAYRFESPIIAAPMDSVVSPASAATLAANGVLAVLNLEGLWGRYEDPDPLLKEIAALAPAAATTRMQDMYSAQPVDADLVKQRIATLREAGSTVAVGMSPQGASQLAPIASQSGADIIVIRGTTVSAEHVSGEGEALNLKEFIHELDAPVIVGGCATHQAALHLMRTGAAGVLVGFGGGASHTTADVLGVRVPMASAIADVAAARRDYLDESGGRYVHVIADGSMGGSGDLVKAFACGADAAMVGSIFARATDAPGHGAHWGAEAWHRHLPRGERNQMETVGTLAEILNGPSRSADGTMNILGALRKAMATTGYSDLKEFQRVEMVVTA